nr:MAG TPA: hypothetical protein [Bacteriophage sp.]
MKLYTDLYEKYFHIVNIHAKRDRVNRSKFNLGRIYYNV